MDGGMGEPLPSCAGACELLRRADRQELRGQVAGAVRAGDGRSPGALPRRAGGGGAALELGIGTGRIAIPLSRRGVRVHGIELSPDMVAELRAKAGTDDIGVTVGDFASTRVAGRVTLAYLGRNTIMNLATQIASSHHYWVVDGRLETLSAPFRYVWPSELDLMARLAGMTLRERWADWDRAPFTSDSRSHVSVWEKTMEPVVDVLEDPPMTDQYLAGACNIGPAEIAMRRRAGHAGLVVTAALAAVLLRSDLHPAWRLVLALPAAGSAAGYLQARQRFCANFGWRGVYNFGAMGQEQRVADDRARAEDRRRALRVMGASAAVAAGGSGQAAT